MFSPFHHTGGSYLWGHFGTDMKPGISKPTSFMNLCVGFENRDPFIYLPFEILIYSYISLK